MSSTRGESPQSRLPPMAQQFSHIPGTHPYGALAHSDQPRLPSGLSGNYQSYERRANLPPTPMPPPPPQYNTTATTGPANMPPNQLPMPPVPRPGEQSAQETGQTQKQMPPQIPMPPPRGADAAAHSNEVVVNSSGPRDYVGHDSRREYKLRVVQQPQRARMCGFGDKDRRPITPPPCIRVDVIDLATGGEVSVNQLSYQHFVLHVDLWNADGTEEVSMVRHNNAPNLVSTGSTLAYTDGIESRTPQTSAPFRVYEAQPGPGYSTATPAYPSQPNGYGAPAPAAPSAYGYPTVVRRPGDVVPQGTSPSYSHGEPSPIGPGRNSVSHGSGGGSQVTRNLIGSVSNSASRLVDGDNRVGIWFVLQDLSIRTEGIFRLRFQIINTLNHGAINPNGISDAKLLNKKVCRTLAYTFSEPFQVYSAKKFPGVCESTPLSKAFAAQGVKIPIRKDGADASGAKGKGKKRAHEDDDEDEDEDDE